MTKGLLAELELNKIFPDIEIYNRSVSNAESIAKQFSFVKKVGSLQNFNKTSGDILINTSTIGAPWNKGDDFHFEDKIVTNFDVVADVNFVPVKTPLIITAERLDKITVPGWQTFKYGTAKCFQTILDIKVDTKILGEELVSDFTHNWS